MNEEEAVKNVTQKKERKIKPKSKKGEKNEENSMGTQREPQNISAVARIEHVQISGNEEIVEMKRDQKKDKAKKNKGGKVAEADMKKDAEKEELTVAYGEDSSGNAADNVEKKRKKREKNESKDDRFEMIYTKEVGGNEDKKLLDGESMFEIKSIEDATKERKKQKMKRKQEDKDFEVGEKDGKEVGQDSPDCEDHAVGMVERKKRKKDKKKNKDDNRWQDNFSEAKNEEKDGNDGNATKEPEQKKKRKKNKKKEHYKNNSSVAQQDNADPDSNDLMNTDEMQSDEVEYANKKKKKHTQLMKNVSDDLRDNGVESEKKGKNEKTKSVDNGSNDATTPTKSNKKVRFSGQVEVFPLPDDSNTEKDNEEEENLVRGKRFTHEEDEILKEAVLTYIHDHDLGDEGLKMVLNSKKHREVKGCWHEIGSAIPYRPRSAIYYRAQILFRRSEDRRWTQEEYDLILKHQEKHGNEWKTLADALGKHRFHVKDTWRRIKLSDQKKGHWSQDEYQKLFDLVNVDLLSKLSEEKISKHGMLRDNICWTVISDELSTRSNATCCVKWYNQLTSPMVAQGIWADTDDYRLIDALYSLDATCMEDVDWDDLVDDRTGDICRKRWNQMVMHIGRHGHKSFAEQVEVLAQRYCPHLLEARETWDCKPRVP